jgi:predicted metal-binding protein
VVLIKLGHNAGQPETVVPTSLSENPQRVSGVKPGPSTIVSVCTVCRAAAADEALLAGEAMLAALIPLLREQAPDVTVRPVRCLGVCKRPATVAISAREGYTFVFGDLDSQDGAAAVAAFVISYQATDYGFVPRAARPELLRTRLVARIPSALWSPPDGQPPA